MLYFFPLLFNCARHRFFAQLQASRFENPPPIGGVSLFFFFNRNDVFLREKFQCKLLF